MLSSIRWRLSLLRARCQGFVRWHGVRVFFPPGSVVARHILIGGQWESEITSLLLAAVRPGSTVFDVGANVGASAIPILAAFPDVRVVSLEPSPSVLPYLQRTREGTRFRDRWEIIPLAVTARDGEEVDFTRCPGGGDVYEGLKDTGRGGGGAPVRVRTTTVDTQWGAAGRPPVSLLKIDVEGAELGVLARASNCLRACRPVVVTEWCKLNIPAYGNAPEDLLDVAARERYDVYTIPGLTRVDDRRLFPFQFAMHENWLLLPTL